LQSAGELSSHKYSSYCITDHEIVDNILSLYLNKELWQKVSTDSKKVIEPFSIATIEEKIVRLIQ